MVLQLLTISSTYSWQINRVNMFTVYFSSHYNLYTYPEVLWTKWSFYFLTCFYTKNICLSTYWNRCCTYCSNCDIENGGTLEIDVGSTTCNCLPGFGGNYCERGHQWKLIYSYGNIYQEKCNISVAPQKGLMSSNFFFKKCNIYIYMSHFSYACKMRYPLNLALENSKYLWFYWTFCIVILYYGLKLHKLQKWLEIH